MSTRTSAMTHLNGVALGFIDHEKKAGELANDFYIGVRMLMEECGDKDILTEYDKTMLDVEAIVKKELPEGETLSAYCGSWKKKKSQIRRGLKAGINPLDHEKQGAFLKATDELTGGNSLGKPKPTTIPTNDNTTPTSKETGNVSPVVNEVTTGNKLSETARKRLNSMIQALEALPESEQLTVLSNCEGAIRSKLKKMGGRMANLKTA